MSHPGDGAATTAVEAQRRPDQRHPGRWRAAWAGLLAAAAALGVAELVAGLLDGAPSLVIAVGDAVIDSVPGDVERQAIALLGRYDKVVLLTGILVLSGVFGALLGLLAARRFVLGATGIAAFALLGGAAALADPQAALLATVLVCVAGALSGIVALRLLVTVAAARPATEQPGRGLDRRNFLLVAAGTAAVAAVSAFGGQVLRAREGLDDIRAAIRIPRPVRPAPPPPPAASLDIPGLTPLYVPNEEFYRIDTALSRDVRAEAVRRPFHRQVLTAQQIGPERRDPRAVAGRGSPGPGTPQSSSPRSRTSGLRRGAR